MKKLKIDSRIETAYKLIGILLLLTFSAACKLLAQEPKNEEKKELEELREEVR